MRHRLSDDQGFTLIELLVVILIIGILAAIALPSFVSQRDRARDSVAKENARNAVSHVESCVVNTEDYQQCKTSADLGGGTGLMFGGSPGQVSIASTTTDSYTVTAYSVSGSSFTIKRPPGGGSLQRGCVLAPGAPDTGCKNGTW